ncbi:c-type cytochrome [Maridesulfovibrio bastinii]|uniref:c-type cytochrome n=1 Tax=Maridesulfovibrio bastinii TaxID=47157 RepID=UPI0004058353|nr:c-type cytochrome [Maridesulfovibrio bastinii]
MMGQTTDLFLSMPMPDGWLHFILFVLFGLHLLFVLLMLGTAMMSLIFYLQNKLSSDGVGLSWNRSFIKPHLGLKSIAVVLGVGPLLVMQIIYSYGFYTTTGLYSYSWLAIIPLLIVAFLLIELFEHRMTTGTLLPLTAGVLGLGALLTVPAIFTGVMSLMERPGDWAVFGAHKMGLSELYIPHWLFRYLHVLGAAIVFGAAFHLFVTAKGDQDKKVRMRCWILGGILFQVVVGVPLLISVSSIFNWQVLTAVTVGTAAAMIAAWMMFSGYDSKLGTTCNLLWILPVIFVAMLAARQFLQDSTMIVQNNQVIALQRAQDKDFAQFKSQALKIYQSKLNTIYDNGATIYDGSCSSCHGTTGLGDGPSGRRLLIKPEVLAAVHANRKYLRKLVLEGVEGTGMPYFRMFDGNKIDDLLAEMQSRFAIFSKASSGPKGDKAAAKSIWANTCVTCHGENGAVTEFGSTLHPIPPDLRYYSLSPERSMEIITNGYPGTVMQPYRQLPLATRQGLVDLVASLCDMSAQN